MNIDSKLHSLLQQLKQWGSCFRAPILKKTSYLYHKLHLEEIGFFFLFLCHRYSVKQFSPLYVHHNLKILARLDPTEGLTSTRKGKLLILSGGLPRKLFSLKNFLFVKALQKRVETVVYYTYVTITIELNNPFTKSILLQFLRQKIAFLERHLALVKVINGKAWDQSTIRLHLSIFERNSLVQAQVIETMHLAIKRQKAPPIIKEAKAAIHKGLHPVLATQGMSGAYWMRGMNRQILGIFKPFDEEIQAPNNPLGLRFQGAMGLRKTRLGCRVGESAHHEVAAFLVDAFFGFGIVPKTYYAEFTHSAFFLAREDRFVSRRRAKTKMGSFQEFVGGFVSIYKLKQEEVASIPLDEFQLLIALDVIIGNADRNIGNILFGEDKIAAIDHGLCFPDRGYELSYWYWKVFEQGHEPLFQPIVALFDHFPYDTLCHQLSKKCFISPNALQRMRERVALFKAALHADFTPAQIEPLFTPSYLAPLHDLNTTLSEAAATQVQLYQSHLRSLKKGL
jgi:hypothetical protein